MDISLIVSIISMLAAVGSFILALKAKSDVKQLEQKIINIENNSSNITNENYGTNSGVMAGNITGGVSIDE